MNISVFRKDRKNVGDWYSVPASHLPLRAVRQADLVKPDTIPNEPGIVVLGGGGLGRPDFSTALRHLMRDDRKYSVIAWGVGADTVTKRGELLEGPEDMQSLLGYFEGMDEVGTRIDLGRTAGANPGFQWVPCASCLSPIFEQLSDLPVKRQIGVYEHLRESVVQHLPQRARILNRVLYGVGFENNRGANLYSKLKFLAESEFVFTNSYHGVYWATLLGRKVVCFPFKNGLFSFRHAPAYFDKHGIEAAMDKAQRYPDALKECRLANLNFYFEMMRKYGDL